jgi:type II secretory pathway component PulF
MITKIKIYFAKKKMRANRSDFYYDLGLTLEDRVPLFTTLRKYESRARTHDEGASLVYLEMIRKLQSASLAVAFEGIASDSEIIMLDALETSGDAGLAQGLKFLSETVEKVDGMINIVRGAIVYPLTILSLLTVIATGFAFYVVPVLTQILDHEKWPFLGKMLYFLSQGIINYGLYILAFLVLLIIGFVWSLSRWTGAVRKKLDRHLPYSLYRDFSGAMLIVSISSMMRSGISLRSALERANKHSNSWMKDHIRHILYLLSQPTATTFGQAFKTGVLNKYLEERVQDASERKNPIEAFVRIGVGSIDRINLSIKKSTSKLNLILLLFCGVILMIMLGGFFSTALELQSGIRDQSRVQTR